MEEISIIFSNVKVEPRTIKTKWKLVEGKPIFGMARVCWSHYGIKNRFQYWMWKRKMVKNWKNGR